MRYANIKCPEIENGTGVGLSLFVQGCPIHCKGCFNFETWEFDGGREFDDEVRNELLKKLEPEYISRFSVLGGEPLANQNINDVIALIDQVRKADLVRKIWVYTGYDPLASEEGFRAVMKCAVCGADYAVVGPFIEDMKVPGGTRFFGSWNQKILDLKVFQNVYFMYSSTYSADPAEYRSRRELIVDAASRATEKIGK